MRGPAFCDKRVAIFLATPEGGKKMEVSGMRFRSIGAGVASLMLITVIGTGCAKKEDTATATRAEQAAARAEDAARRAEAAASRVDLEVFPTLVAGYMRSPADA